MKFTNLLVGGDPEFFVFDAASGAPKSLIGKLGGTKANPKSLGYPGYHIQEDNVAGEFNFPPARDSMEFMVNVSKAIDLIYKVVSKQGFEFCSDRSLVFPDAELSDPKAKEFGCDPDYNAWTGEENPKPKSDEPNLRSVGGHIHISWKPEEDEDADNHKGIMLMRAMDICAGLPSLIEDIPGFRRRALYGKAGSFRQVKTGWFEYRVLSNYWIWREVLVGNIFTRVVTAVNLLGSKKGYDFVNSVGEEVVSLIDSADVPNKFDVASINKIIGEANELSGINGIKLQRY